MVTTARILWTGSARRALAALIVLVASLLGALATPGAVRIAHASTTFTVNSTGDAPDKTTSDGRCWTGTSVPSGAPGTFEPQCTLRAAIEQANVTPGVDTISFDIPTYFSSPYNKPNPDCDQSTGVCTISPTSGLPRITDAVTIDGYTQPGASPNTLARGTNARLKIELSGAQARLASGIYFFLVGSSGSTLRGLAINRWDSFGVAIFLSGTNTIEGNFIGTDASGTRKLGNLGGGAYIVGDHNAIGGTSPAARNLISATIGGNGVDLIGSDNKVQGNLIGTTASGTAPLGNDRDGVRIHDDAKSTMGNMVGGTSPAAGNVIAFNGARGVSVEDPFPAYLATKNPILSNSIHDNGALGIDLGGDGVTPNDPRDQDTGANGLQNYPTITSAIKSGPITTIRGTLNSAPGQTFTLQFFSNSAVDPSGFGEGKTPLGQTTVTTNGLGGAAFSFVTKRSVGVGQVVTATATSASGDTSEFSRGVLLKLDGTKPTITPLAPKPGSRVRGRNVLIRARVRDGQGEALLQKGNIRLFVDGRRRAGFVYDQPSYRLSFTAKNLSAGRHRVRITARDGAGNVGARGWIFTIVKKR